MPQQFVSSVVDTLPLVSKIISAQLTSTNPSLPLLKLHIILIGPRLSQSKLLSTRAPSHDVLMISPMATFSLQPSDGYSWALVLSSLCLLGIGCPLYLPLPSAYISQPGNFAPVFNTGWSSTSMMKLVPAQFAMANRFHVVRTMIESLATISFVMLFFVVQSAALASCKEGSFLF